MGFIVTSFAESKSDEPVPYEYVLIISTLLSDRSTETRTVLSAQGLDLEKCCRAMAHSVSGDHWTATKVMTM